MNSSVNRKALLLCVAVTGLLVGALESTHADVSTLRIGLASAPTAIDPHFHNATNNSQINEHIFESVLTLNAELEVRPGLAEAFRLVDDTTWEFKLRRNVKFHDGTSFDANDVIFSFCRVPLVPNSPGRFTIYTSAIADMVAKDPHTLIIKTKTPYPNLPRELATIRIISDSLINGEKVTFQAAGCKIAAQWPKTDDFNSGISAIGTGPYRYLKYVKGDHVALQRNETYWGARPAWGIVHFRSINDPGKRIGALLAGDVDFIEEPPPQDILRFQKKDSQYKIVSKTSVRTIYMHMDQRADNIVPTGVVGTNGKNPFRDERVRQALSKAIDRNAIANRVMSTFARPAEQLMAKEYFGADRLMPALRYDPDGARRLLAEAGYPNGFEVTLFSTSDRYVNDAKIAEAIAQMWTNVGVKAKAVSMPGSQFFPKRSKHEFGIYMAGWAPRVGEISSALRALLCTPNKEKGWGTANYGPYSDPVLDAMVERALATMNDVKRMLLLRQASKRATEKLGAIPIHYEITPWAMRKGISYTPRGDQYTLAFEIEPEK